MRTHRKAFTMIELTIVIGILLLLMGMVVVGFKHIGNSGKVNATKTAMETWRSMLAELDASSGSRGLSQRQPAFMWVNNLQNTTSGFNIWKVADPTAVAPGPPVPLHWPPLVAPATGVTSDFPTRFQSDAIRNTVMVMSVLQTMPNNRAMRGKIPPEKLVVVHRDTDLQPATGSKYPDSDPAWTPTTFQPAQFPILLDGWGNPIIFVPCGRDSNGVNTGGLKVTISGVTQIIYSPDFRPFFASAGPDGNFSFGDDNIYSFEN